jgi:hypothetical protein
MVEAEDRDVAAPDRHHLERDDETEDEEPRGGTRELPRRRPEARHHDAAGAA